MKLYDRIKHMADKKGVSINQLEEDLGFSSSSISKWNKSQPSSERLQKVADYFDVTTDYLLGKTDIPNLKREVERYEQFDKLTNQDVAENLKFLIDQLDSENYGLMFEGEEIDDNTRNLLLGSLKNTYEIAKQRKDGK